ncbi:LOW QUALITY PROTEIN: uncharacterized protein LOC119555944 [Drosophila subpulchrella]|uniref:LOW QUALITY PROTEIN: uncharacterized protein LOC119555944 n=1 Tax=Drosophila subpulchrella TaxID=1486046 RepID=UPI0018A14888|nr:LOW QUALITY PROTEIN: uncharacterized protein LOC119555944 [Drosophila subpulchrella]
MMNATTQSRSSCPIWESRPESGPGSRPYDPEPSYINGIILYCILGMRELFKLPWAGATNIQQQLGAAAADRLQIAQVQVAAPLQPLRPLRPQASIAPPTKTKTTTKTKTKKIRAR